MSKNGRNRKNPKTRLDLILSVVSIGMMIAMMVLDELDRRKKPPVVFPEVDPDETREEVREEMQAKEEEALREELPV